MFAAPISFVFRISGAALSYHDTITQVFHNGQPLPACPSADPNGCYTSIAYDKWTKVWTVQVQARSNGLWGGPVDPTAACVEGQLTPCRVTLVR